MSSQIITWSGGNDKEEHMLVYLSGPISGDPEYKEKFRAAEESLTNDCFVTVLNPAKLSDAFPGLSESKYLQLALILVTYADAVYMMKGWEFSKGACIEYLLAKQSGKRIMYQSGEPEDFLQ